MFFSSESAPGALRIPPASRRASRLQGHDEEATQGQVLLQARSQGHRTGHPTVRGQDHRC